METSSLFVLKFKDGKVANFQNLFDVATWRQADRAGTRGASVACWINEEDAVAYHDSFSRTEMIWGEVEVGMGWETIHPLLDGNSVAYRIHKTKSTQVKKKIDNDVFGTFTPK